MFEPTRLSGEYLVDAYSQTVPMRLRSLHSAGEAARGPEAVQHTRAARRQTR